MEPIFFFFFSFMSALESKNINMLRFKMLQVNSNGHSGVGLLTDKVASEYCVWWLNIMSGSIKEKVYIKVYVRFISMNLGSKVKTLSVILFIIFKY